MMIASKPDCLDRLHRVDGGVVELHALPDADRARSRAPRSCACPRRSTRSPPRRSSRSTGYSCRTRWRRCRSSCTPGRSSLACAARTPRPPSSPTARAMAGSEKPIRLASRSAPASPTWCAQHPLADRRCCAPCRGTAYRSASGGDHARIDVAPEQLGDGEDAVVGTDADVVDERLRVLGVELLHVQVVHADLQRADGLEQALLDRAADAHDLAGRLHLGGQVVVRGGELVEREARHFRHHIVQRRLKRWRACWPAGSRRASCPPRSSPTRARSDSRWPWTPAPTSATRGG